MTVQILTSGNWRLATGTKQEIIDALAISNTLSLVDFIKDDATGQYCAVYVVPT